MEGQQLHRSMDEFGVGETLDENSGGVARPDCGGPVLATPTITLAIGTFAAITVAAAGGGDEKEIQHEQP